MFKLIYLAGLIVLFTACASISNKGYSYKSYDKYYLHTKTGQVALTSPLPLDKSYAELTEAQKQIARSYNGDLSQDDHPAYPKKGLTSLYSPLMDQSRIHLYKGSELADRAFSIHTYVPPKEGNLLAVATITAAGKVESVNVLESTSKEQAEYAVEVLRQTEFDPGTCDGEACQSEYLLQLKLDVWHSRGKSSYMVYPPKTR